MKYLRENTFQFEYESGTISKIENDHFHKKVEVFLVADGKVRLKLPSRNIAFEMTSGDYAVINGAEYHSIQPDVKANIETIRFPINYVSGAAEQHVTQSFVVPNAAVCENELTKTLLGNLFEAIRREQCGAKNRSLISNLSSTVYSLLLTLYDKRKIAPASGIKQGGMKETKKLSYEMICRFDSVLSYISENYCDPSLSLTSVSSRFGINKTNLCDMFPKLTGSNFMSWIHELRINHSIELMNSTEKSISEIALLSGFDTIRSFNNVFKKVTKVTPSGFLASMKGSGNDVCTSIDGIGGNIANYKWYCTGEDISFMYNADDCSMEVTCKNGDTNRWVHLWVPMLFKAGQRYKVTYTAKKLCNAKGEGPSEKPVGCQIYFGDDEQNFPFHHPEIFEERKLEDGWSKYTCYFTVPSYYVPSAGSRFSVYSNPTNDIGTSFVVKDIKMRAAKRYSEPLNE